jgi:hypothetical protein
MNRMRSLQVPRNPLARLQEMEAEMAPDVAPQPLNQANSQESFGPATERTHAPTNARTNERANAETHPHTNARTKEPDEVEKAALSQLLSTPLESDFLKGPFQAGTVRMPTELWKRVGWIASFTGRTKQDIIGEALLAYLERIKNERS